MFYYLTHAHVLLSVIIFVFYLFLFNVYFLTLPFSHVKI